MVILILYAIILMSGAKDSGNEVVEIFINDKNINYCKACAYCEKHNMEYA